MKNIIISMLATWIFWKEICVVQPIWGLPLIFFVVLVWISCIEEEVMERKKNKQYEKDFANMINRIRKDGY